MTHHQAYAIGAFLIINNADLIAAFITQTIADFNLNIKADVYNVSILDNVIFSF